MTTTAVSGALAVLLAVTLVAAIPTRAARYRAGLWVPIVGPRNAMMIVTLTLAAGSSPSDMYARIAVLISAFILAGLETAAWLDLNNATEPGRHSKALLAQGSGA